MVQFPRGFPGGCGGECPAARERRGPRRRAVRLQGAAAAGRAAAATAA